MSTSNASCFPLEIMWWFSWWVTQWPEEGGQVLWSYPLHTFSLGALSKPFNFQFEVVFKFHPSPKIDLLFFFFFFVNWPPCFVFSPSRQRACSAEASLCLGHLMFCPRYLERETKSVCVNMKKIRDFGNWDIIIEFDFVGVSCEMI